MSTDADRDHVYRQVRRCLGALVGGSGHLAAYTLDRSTFRIEGVRELEGGAAEYAFAVSGWRESEFSAEAVDPDDGAGAGPAFEGAQPEFPAQPAPEPGREELRGTLVLEANGDLALDETGRVRLAPWRTLDPEWL